MKLLLGSVLVLAITLGLLPARAEKIDLSTGTCSKFQNSDKEEIGIILARLNSVSWRTPGSSANTARKIPASA